MDLTLLRFSAQKENPLPKGNISGRKKTQSVFFLGVEGHVEIVGTGGEEDERNCSCVCIKYSYLYLYLCLCLYLYLCLQPENVVTGGGMRSTKSLE